MCLDLLTTLRELVLRSVHIPFFMMEHRVISKLQNYYAFVGSTVAFAYLWLVVATWRSPYGLSNNVLQVWLTILALYPLAIFVISFQQIHIFMRNIKLSHLAVINREVQEALSNVQTSSSKNLDDAERLEKLMDIQTKVENVREWPIGSQTTFAFIVSFIITFVTAITQVIIAYMRVQKP
jgi:ABC-type multidrug transport system fused ATPase/permease subunit